MLNVNEIKNADYNPRNFNPENYEALGDSMEEFGDISGITFNTRTGNLITGHHRWNQLCQKYGIDNLSLKQISNTDLSIILESGHDTGYTLRVVDWCLDKEKLANVTANSESVSGHFTSDLKSLLASVDESNKSLVSKLKLDSIKVPKVKITKPSKGDIDLDDENESTPQKSETIISGGGETYLTIRLELTPETAKEFQNMLDNFKTKGDGVEEPLKRIIGFMGKQDPEEVIKSVRVRKRH
ncbi:MAG: hypothetical protein HRU18_01475 [Pseudoalteromonas sp.]|uniref:hypothetical protein n=1 Tax=Pseudoalteromonas sp. TaxID=53249 RepID=UPI001DC1FFA8|nr:hypothetical protein [Pseudoalteromonas sp.]NRA76851.1 hypothetical protein [Pseudoalteromonas sp.]